jgi:hypothetical protein
MSSMLDDLLKILPPRDSAKVKLLLFSKKRIASFLLSSFKVKQTIPQPFFHLFLAISWYGWLGKPA